MPTRAVYAEIREAVRRRITSGVWDVGTKIPTEAELQAEYGVSRITVQQALRDLAREGLITRHPGRGSYVSRAARQENLVRMTDFLAGGPELPGTHRLFSVTVVPRSEVDIALAGVDVPGDEPIIDIRRLKEADGRPVALERTIVPFRVAPLLLREPLDTTTVYDYLHRAGTRLGRARMYVRPHRFDEREAAALGIAAGALGFLWERVTFLESGALAEVARFTVRADVIDFYVEYDAERPR